MMALRPLYATADATDIEYAINIVIVPGLGLPSPSEWKNSSGSWLEELRRSHSNVVRIWYYDYKVLKGQSVVASLMQQSHKFLGCLRVLNSRDVTCRPMVIICHSLGGCIWKQAYANMFTKQHDNHELLEQIVATIFLGTPHTVDATSAEVNIIEYIVRTGSAPFSFLSFAPTDNQFVAKVSRDFRTFNGQVIATFETMDSRYRGVIWKGGSFKSRRIIPEKFVDVSGIVNAKLYGIASNHEGGCKLDIHGDIYKVIANVIGDAITSATQKDSEVSLQEIESSVLDGWDKQTLRSHRSGMAEPDMGLSPKPTLSLTRSRDDSISNLFTPEIDSGPKRLSVTPSASAGYSSQFSYEIVQPAHDENLQKSKLAIPCLSLGSQTRKDNFFGREEILRSIDKTLLPDIAPSPIEDFAMGGSLNLKTFALCGAGGIGKTELASEYVFSRKHMFSAIFWVTGDTRLGLLKDYGRIARDLGLQDDSDAPDLAEASERVKGWLCNPVIDPNLPLSSENNEASWLLVLDNVDDWLTIEDFWPNTGIGSILMTSRDPLSRSHIYTGQHGLDLQPFTSSETLLFMNATAHKSLKGSPASAKAIAEWAGGLPLIITAITGAMSSQNLNYDQMLEELRKRGFEAVKAESRPQNQSVQTISIASMVGLAKLDPTTRSLIQTISFLNPEGMLAKMLVTELTSVLMPTFPKTLAELNAAQSKLQQASLVTYDESNRTIRMHRIFQDIVRESMDPESRIKALSAAMQLVSDAWIYQPLEHRFDIARYETCSTIFPHIDYIYQHYEKMFKDRQIDPSEQAAALFNDAGWYLFERGLPQESKRFCKLAQHICEALQQRKPSPSVQELLRQSHNNQGSAANETNKPQESLQHNTMWLSLMQERRAADGAEIIDYELGCVYNEVGVAHAMNNMYSLAMEYFQRSVKTYKQLPNYDEKWLGWPLPNIGMMHWLQGEHAAALESLEKIRKIYEVAYGLDDRQSFKTGKILYAIGNVHLTLGDLEKALEFHTRSLNQWSETLGPTHHRIGDVCHKIAQDLMAMGHFDQAQDCLNRALRIFARRPYYKHEQARTVFRQGQLFFAQEKTELAEQSFKAAHKQRQSLLPYDPRPWDALLDKDYDDLVIYMSR